MIRAIRIVLFLCTVRGQHDVKAWPDAVIAIAEKSFQMPVVLFLDNQDYLPHRRTLSVFRDSSKRARVLSVLARNFSLVVANRKYTRPGRNLGVRVNKAGQIIAVVGEKTASDLIGLQETIQMWRNHAFWFSQAKILIVVEVTTNGRQLATNIITQLWRKTKSANVLVFTSSENVTEFYSFVPYDQSCNIKIKNLGTWNKAAAEHFQAFPQWTFRNLNNCTLHVTANEIIPYVFPPDENGDYSDGIEIQILQYFSKFFNFSLKFVGVPKGENPWLTTINGTATGFIGMLVRGDSDIVVSGARLNYDRSMHADPLDSYIGEDFVWVGPAAQCAPEWKAIFLVYSPTLWLAIATAFSTAFLFLTVIFYKKLHNSPSDAFLVIWAASFNSSIPSTLLLSPTIRAFLSFFLFYALTINSLYTSALYEALTNGFQLRAIDSNQEAADRGLTASIYASNIPDLQQTVPAYYKTITEKNLVIWSNDNLSCLRRAARFGDCYSLYTALGAEYQMNMRFTTNLGRQYVRIMKNRYKTYDPTIYMSRHHPLFAVFRKRIRQLIENGWIKAVTEDIMSQSLRKRTVYSEVNDLSEKEGHQTLNVGQILGAFIAASIILLLAITAFIYELLS